MRCAIMARRGCICCGGWADKMTDTIDEIKRDAIFEGDYRRLLIRDWGSPPRAFIIGCNPSDADAYKDDATSRWWNRWFKKFNFGGYDAANLYSFCTSDPEVCRQRRENALADPESSDYAELFLNIDYVVAKAKQADQIFVCFGNNPWDWDSSWIESVVKKIQSSNSLHPDLWCWGVNNNSTPRHPATRGRYRVQENQPPILWRAAN